MIRNRGAAAGPCACRRHPGVYRRFPANIVKYRVCFNRYFGLSDGYFSGMQMDFERIAAKRKLSSELEKIIPFGTAHTQGSQRSCGDDLPLQAHG